MESEFTTGKLIVYIGPLISAIVSLIFLHIGMVGNKNELEKKLTILLTLYFSCVATNWIFAIGSALGSQFVATFHSVAYITILSVQVLLYHYLYVLTSTNGDKPFSRWHYVYPVLAGLVVLVWSFFIPSEVNYWTVYGRAPATGVIINQQIIDQSANYSAFIALVHSKYAIRMLYNIGYTILGIWRVVRYRRFIVNYSADTDKMSLQWLLILLLLSMPMLISPLLLANSSLLSANLAAFRGALPALFMFCQMPVLCYFTITRRFVLMDDREETLPTETDQQIYSTTFLLSAEKVERYMAADKPYLRSDMKITDMTVPLHTNRSTLSAFINSTYGMNFSQFVNGYRLRELETLAGQSSTVAGNNLELIRRAGFGSYHGFYRAKKQYEARKAPPPENE